MIHKLAVQRASRGSFRLQGRIINDENAHEPARAALCGRSLEIRVGVVSGNGQAGDLKIY